MKAFDNQNRLGIDNKIVIFTESKRTQKYIAAELRKNGFKEDDVLTFNGEGIIKPSTLHYDDNILFSDVIVADSYAQSHMSDYAKSMSLGVHLNLMAFESTVAKSLNFTLKDLGFTSYYN